MIRAKVSLENMEGFDAQLVEVLTAIDANLKETATVVRDDAKATLKASRITGNLHDSLSMRKSRYPDGGYIVMASGSNSQGDPFMGDIKEDNPKKKPRKTKKGFHAFNVEFGHVMIAWGRVTGERVPPYPFLRPALEVGIKHAVNLFRSNKK